MKDISMLMNKESLNKDTSKFKKFLSEYGHEVFLRILLKSMFIVLAFTLLEKLLDGKFGLEGLYKLSLLISIIMLFAYFVGSVIDHKYTWIYQVLVYSFSSFVVLQFNLMDIINLDFKIMMVFFVFLFSIAIKNPLAHISAVSINLLVGIIYFEIHDLIAFINKNNYFMIMMMVFSVIFMNYRSYKTLRAEFFEDQRYLAKSSLISSIGNRYDIESFKNMVEKSAVKDSLYKYKLFFDNTFNLYMIFDESQVYEINDGLLNILGIKKDKIKDLDKIINFNQVIKKSNTFENSNHKFTLDNRDIYINSVVTEIELNNKKIYMLSGYDNTSNVMINNKIEKSLELREKIVELNKVIIEEDLICDTLNKIINMTVSVIENASYGSVLIYDEDTGFLNIECFRGYESELISEFKVKLEDSYIYNLTAGKLDKTVLSKSLGEKGVIKVRNVLNNDDHIIITSTISSPLYLNGKFYGIVCVDSSGKEGFDDSDVQSVEYIRNQIEIALGKKLVFDEVKRLSNTDVLTGTFNRRYFENTIYKILEDVKIKSYHFVVIDLDNLKHVNDNFGHAFGDSYIKAFVSSLKNHMRSEDFIVRSGGDEFTLTFKGMGLDLLEERLKKITEELDNNPLFYEGEKVQVKFSYGIASYPIDSKDRDELLKIADDKMYKMKKKNKF